MEAIGTAFHTGSEQPVWIDAPYSIHRWYAVWTQEKRKQDKFIECFLILGVHEIGV